MASLITICYKACRHWSAHRYPYRKEDLTLHLLIHQLLDETPIIKRRPNSIRPLPNL